MGAVGVGGAARLAARLVLGALVVLAGLEACGGKSGDQAPPGQAAQGTGLEVSLTGYVSKTYDGDQDLCITATRSALQRLGLKVDEESGGMFRKSFEASGQDGTSVALEVTELTKSTTRIGIKVGYLFGDRDAAQRIHSEIEGELSARGEQAKDAQRKWRSLAAPGAAPAPADAPATPAERPAAGAPH